MNYKILSLDGGGSWAIIQLLTLKHKFGNIEGHKILKEFDMVIANSAGSIVLAALAENWTIDKALSLFKDKSVKKKVFAKNRFRDRFFPTDFLGIVSGSFPKYSAEKKYKTFSEFFPELDKRQMNELPAFIGKESLKLVVCTFDALDNRAKFFKSYGESQSRNSVKLTQAVHGSSNAPVSYFDFPAIFEAANSNHQYMIWDGALGGFNNPVAAGVIEAIKAGVSVNDLKVISIGTANKLMSLEKKNEFGKIIGESISAVRKHRKISKLKYQLKYFKDIIVNQAKTILYEPPDWANYVAYMFLRKDGETDISDRLIRMSPMIYPHSGSTPEIRKLLNELYYLDMDITANSEIQLLEDCFNYWASDKILNQPICYKISEKNDLVYLQGDKYFSDAIKKW